MTAPETSDGDKKSQLSPTSGHKHRTPLEPTIFASLIKELHRTLEERKEGEEPKLTASTDNDLLLSSFDLTEFLDVYIESTDDDLFDPSSPSGQSWPWKGGGEQQPPVDSHFLSSSKTTNKPSFQRMESLIQGIFQKLKQSKIPPPSSPSASLETINEEAPSTSFVDSGDELEAIDELYADLHEKFSEDRKLYNLNAPIDLWVCIVKSIINHDCCGMLR